MADIRCVIFDVGGVLATERLEGIFAEANAALGTCAFMSPTPLGKKFALGKVTERLYFATLAQKSGIPALQLKKALHRALVRQNRVNQPVLSLARALKQKGYRIGIISNVTPDFKRMNRDQNIYTPFHHVVLSCDVGFVKPQRGIFALFLRRARIDASRCVFIDDRKQHLAAAREIGMHTILFKTSIQLRSDLKKLGVRP